LTAANGVGDVCNGAPGAPGNNGDGASDVFATSGTSLDLPTGSYVVNAVLSLSGTIGQDGRNLRCTLNSSGTQLDTADVELPGSGSGGAVPQLRVALIGVLQSSAPTTVTVGCITPASATFPVASSRIVASAAGIVH